MSKSTLRQYLASGACALSVAVVAVCFFWLEPLMSWLVSPDSEIPGLTTSDTSWLVASVEFGEVVFTIPAGLLADKYGRKLVVLSTGPMCIVGWVVILTTRNLVALYIVRFIHGVAVAVPFTVVPIYIAEIAQPRIRGELSTLFMTFWFLGVLYNYIVGPLCDYQTYTYLCLIPPVIFIVVFAYMPESPYYLFMVGKTVEAEKALKWLRCSEEVDEEFKEIGDSVEADMKSKGTWRDLIRTKKDRKAFLIVQLACCMKYLTGMPAITSYATETFKAGSTINTHVLTISLGVILILSTIIPAFISDSVGRRPLLLISLSGATLFNVLIAVYYYLAKDPSLNVTEYYWLMFVAIIGFFVAANAGVAPLLQTMQAEYFPSNTRGIAGGITDVTASVASFINMKQYQMFTDSIGIYFNYVVFAVVGLIGVVTLFFTMEETAGKSLGDIQKDMAQGTRKKTKETANADGSNSVVVEESG